MKGMEMKGMKEGYMRVDWGVGKLEDIEVEEVRKEKMD